MKLDPRIKKDKRPLSCFDVDIAKQFIGKKGYFSNSLSWYSVLKSTWYGTLNEIESQQEECFFDSESDGYFQYFLPDEWVKEPEKKYRPFSLEEFSNIFKVGDLVEFRYKDSDEVKCAMFTGYITDVERIDDKTPGAVELMLGCFHYSLLSLFKECELFLNGEWQPFGVMEDD